MTSLAERSAQAARAAVNAAVRDQYDRRTFTVARFGRHRDGYLHALIQIEGGPSAYFHCRYGSWLAPGTWNGRAVLKEPEALLGTVLGTAVKYELSEQSRKFNPTPPPEEVSDERGSDDQAGGDAGLPEAGHTEDADDEVQPVAG